MDRSRQPSTREAGALGLRPGQVTVALLLIEAVCLLAFLLAGRPSATVRQLALVPALVWREPWRLATSALLHAGLLAAIFDGATLWLFGGPVEARLGRGRMLAVFLGGQLLGSVAATAVGMSLGPERVMVGCAAGGLALVGAFGMAWGNAPLALFGLIRMQARTLALVLVAMALVPTLMRGDLVQLAALAVGAASGMLLGAQPVERLSERWERYRLRRLRSRYRVISGGRDRRGFQT